MPIAVVRTFLAASTAAASLALVLLAATASVSGGTPQKKKADDSKDLYITHCQFCHGPSGNAPVKEMGFVGRKWKTKTHAEAVRVITTGVPGTAMLPFDGKLTKAQIASLARYVRTLDSPAARKKKS